MAEEEQQTEVHAKPAPGWLCVAKVGQQQATVGDQTFQQIAQGMIPHGQGGMLQIPQAIVKAVVVEVGNYDEEFYENHSDVERLDSVHEVGEMVYYCYERGWDVDGFTYIRWDSVICSRPAEE